MNRGYSRTEAEALVGQLFETQATLMSVPRRTRGRVIEALDAGDHWNVLIEWELPHISTQVWYDRFDVRHSMRQVQSSHSEETMGEEMEILEITSSHDLSAKSADARRTGAHSYQVNCRQFNSLLHSWEKDKAQRSGPLALMTLGLERIWITAGESQKVQEAIQAMRSPVALD